MKTWITPYIKQYRGRMSLTVLFGVLGIGSSAMLLFISGYLISKSALKPENIMVVYVPIVAVRMFSISQSSMRYVERLVGHDFILRIVEDMRTRLYKVLEPQALFLHSHYKKGNLLSMLSDDIEHIQDLYLKTIFPSVLSIVIYSLLIGVLGLFDWVFAFLMALLLSVIVFLIPYVSYKMIAKKYIALKKERNTLYEQLTDAVYGLADWIASGRTNTFLTDYRKQEDALVETEKHIQRFQHLRSGFIQLTIGISVIIMIIWTGNEVGEGHLTATLIAAFVLMMLAVTDAIAPTSEAVEQISTYEESLSRLNALEQAPMASHPLREKMDDNTFSTVQLKNVSYHYSASDEVVLRNVSLEIAAGKKIAVLGRSGVGKSTLLKLLIGALQPTSGTILVAGEGAHQSLLAEKLAILNQKSHLFDTTVGNNIRMGRPEASDEEIWEVVKQAQLHGLLSSLPLGLKTPMKEMGHRFSGGERQRIALARVLLQQTPIVIFDEPTIGLDPQTEHALLETMFSAAQDKTVIWVTHHLAGIERMDEVVFLAEGGIQLQGSHEELLASSEKYRTLYEMDNGL